jgi:hypothetical protein
MHMFACGKREAFAQNSESGEGNPTPHRVLDYFANAHSVAEAGSNRFGSPEIGD